MATSGTRPRQGTSEGRPAHLVRGRQRRGSRAVSSRARRYRSPPGFRDGTVCRIGSVLRGRVDRSAHRIVKCEAARYARRGLLRRMVTNHESDADTPGIERSTAGARDVGRLQKSVRSTFSVSKRASQGVRFGRSSVRRMPESSDGGGLHRSTRIGAGESTRRPNKFSRRLTTTVARPWAEPMEDVSGRRRSCLKQARSEAALAKRGGARSRRKSGRESPPARGTGASSRHRRATRDVRGRDCSGRASPAEGRRRSGATEAKTKLFASRSAQQSGRSCRG